MNKVFLVVPYEMKEEAKSLKCFYDMTSKQWYCKPDNTLALSKFSKRYLEVPFDKKDEVKANGAKWCPLMKKWYTYQSNELI